jgi:hypothetical protein
LRRERVEVSSITRHLQVGPTAADWALFHKLASCDFIREWRNVLIAGKTGLMT